jgi:hypothetical protein
VASVAAAVTAIACGYAVTAGGLSRQYADSTAGGGMAAPAESGTGVKAAPDSPATAGDVAAAAPQVRASGVDYRLTTLSTLTASRTGGPDVTAPVPRPPALGPSAGPSRQELAGQGVGALARLLDPAALKACQDAVSTTFPGRVTVIDYARFEGVPALVMVIRADPPASTVVVAVGADCGLAGMDQLASVG